MKFTKQDILSISWNQLYTYAQTVEIAQELYAVEIPTEEEYNKFWNSKKEAK